MKIGIFTFFQTNYGAVLQAFALQTYLQKQPNTDVEIIDFTTSGHLKEHKVLRILKTKKPIVFLKHCLITIIWYKQLRKRVKRTWEFKERYFKFTRRYSTIDDLLQNHPKEDIYITGSDQVFNPNARYVPVYYLNFDKGSSKKVAYAPSFGISKFNDNITSKILNYIKDFDYLSCRETPGAMYLSELTGKTVPVVVDPVMLLEADEWKKVAIEPNYKQDYIFIYDLNGAENLIKIAKNIQKQTQLPILCLTCNRKKIYPINKQFYDAGPAEFIGWIKNASYVVTDSFHGTLFSIIFRKNFFTFIAIEETSSRIKNILHNIDLESRIITKDTLENFDLSTYDEIKNITYNEITEESKSYIKKILAC